MVLTKGFDHPRKLESVKRYTLPATKASRGGGEKLEFVFKYDTSPYKVMLIVSFYHDTVTFKKVGMSSVIDKETFSFPFDWQWTVEGEPVSEIELLNRAFLAYYRIILYHKGNFYYFL